MSSDLQKLSFESGGEDDTRNLGLAIGRSLTCGVLITLQGTLGAGKTNLVQSIAEALEIDRREVVSPTFTLIQTHRGRLDLVHIDAYRIADEDQYTELGIDEMLDGQSVVAMEWAEKFDSLLPSERLAIHIAVSDESGREFLLSWPCHAGPCQELGERIRETLCQ